MRTHSLAATIFTLLAAPAVAAPAGPVQVAVGIAPADLCEVAVPVGGTHTLTCTSGLPLQAEIAVRPDGPNVAVDVSVRQTGDQVHAPDATPAERAKLEAVAAGPVDASTTLLMRPGQTGEMLSAAPEGTTPEEDHVGLTIRATVPSSAD